MTRCTVVRGWCTAIALVCVVVTACTSSTPRTAAEHEWEVTTAPGNFRRLFSESGALFAAGSTESGAPALWKSLDASTWRLVYADPQISGSIAFVAFGESGAVAIGPVRGGRTAFWYTSSDTNLEHVAEFDEVIMHSLVSVRDTYYAVGTRNDGTPTVLRSLGGREWSNQTTIFDIDPLAIREVVSHDGRLYAVGESQRQSVRVASVWGSDDGMSWSLDYRDDAPSSAVVALSTDDHLHVGGTIRQEPTLWTKTKVGWGSTALPSGGSPASIAEMRDGLAALTVPVEAPLSAFSQNSYVQMTRDSEPWTSTRVYDFTDQADRIGNQLVRWRDHLLLLSTTTTTEVWATKW